MPELTPREIAAACEAHDGFSPLNDSARLVLDGARRGEVLTRDNGVAILDDHDGAILVAVAPLTSPLFPATVSMASTM